MATMDGHVRENDYLRANFSNDIVQIFLNEPQCRMAAGIAQSV
jgi:hypothetical protein